MIVQTETAKVYRGRNGRRYFTKYAAYRDAARRKIKSKCECEKADDDYPGQLCWYHDDPERFVRIVRKLAYIYERSDRKEKEGKES